MFRECRLTAESQGVSSCQQYFYGVMLYLFQENGMTPAEVDHLIISKQNSPVTVRVMKTNEELMIARQSRDRLTG